MIRLLEVERYELPHEDEIKRQQGLPYVIFSHVWQQKEILFDDVPQFKIWARTPSPPPWAKSDSAKKVQATCRAVLQRYQEKILHLWLDTVCINKKNLTELSMSINSMYRWYKQAQACFVYLEDFPSKDVSVWTESKWFIRGWTLQELVAPKDVVFFDKHWRVLGNKLGLWKELANRTKIDQKYLLHHVNISQASISQRMSWFGGRETTVPEDTAYCLLGIFGVNMPLLYGEGRERAFRRLQEEIMRYSDDHSLFAWKSPSRHASGLLASYPAYFQGMNDYMHHANAQNNRPFQMTNKGISIDLYLQRYQDIYIATIDCLHDQNFYLGIFLECLSEVTQQYRRVRTEELCRVVATGRGQLKSIFVKPPDDF